MITAPLRVSAPKAAVGGSFLFGGASKSKPSKIKIRCAAARAPAVGRDDAAATLYEVLGLHAGATVREIKAAYRRLARERHPDVAPAPGAAAEFVRLHHAYATLSDSPTRTPARATISAPWRSARGAAAAGASTAGPAAHGRRTSAGSRDTGQSPHAVPSCLYAE